MLSIRLARAGARKRPHYSVVVAEHSDSRDGRFVEKLGGFNPLAADKSAALKVDLARYAYWRERGAQPSAAVKRLLRARRRVKAAAAA